MNSKNDYAFIGRKIEIIETANRDISEIIQIDSITNDTIKLISIPMNFEYRAKYEILHNAYNRIPLDTIEFIVLDHYGRPKFEQFDNVLLFVHYDENTKKYYHEKYKFEPMRRTRNGKWKSLDGKNLKRIIREHYQ
ncbi:hypothetical protein [Nonlabens sp. MIC269]|uniref:hypothetical protein n=1 Tax=Nonlabens sp. MIC269 TaxID=1476901 RepID=UPI0012FCBF9D|nr:hypothetical protein [Nonlabens sp. MIC269]